MPSSTFFRLPAEKRQRLLDAAHAEFQQVRFNDASINRIIQQARIPRGSFYQYFTDKDDLFRYLMCDMRSYFFQTLLQMLRDAQGDLFAVPEQAFDRFIVPDGNADPVLARFIGIIQVNPGLDARWLLGDAELIPDALLQELDLSRLRRADRPFVEHVFCMIVMILAHSIMTSLNHPELRQQHREKLMAQLEIIRFGSLSTPAEHIPAP